MKQIWTRFGSTFQKANENSSIDERPLLLNKKTASKLHDNEINYLETEIEPTQTQVLGQEKYPFYGLLWYWTFCFIFTLSFAITKLLYRLNPDITFIDNLIWKSAVTTLCNFIAAKIKGIEVIKIERNIFMFLCLRILFGVLTLCLLTYAVNFVSMSTFTLIINMSPFYIAIFGYFILSESITSIEILLIFIGYGGIYLICSNKADNKGEDNIFGVMLMVIVSVTAALSAIFLRRVNKVLHPLHSPIFYFFVATCYWIVFIIFNPEYIPKVQKYTLTQSILLLFDTQMAFIGQFLFSSAYAYEKASRLAPYIYLEVVFGILADFFVFQISFTLLQAWGIIIISIWLLIPAFMKYYGYLK